MIITFQLKEISNLLEDFKRIPISKRDRTYLEISGFPHYENVCSNILKFFLNPYAEHGLKDLVLNALVKDIYKEFGIEFNHDKVRVHREVQTLADNRLDLLIETNRFVIGVENKIFHILNNDLEDYSDTIKFYCEYNNKTAINIILSLNKLSTNDLKKAQDENFINVTYNELFSNIHKSIDNYLNNANPTYVLYLNDFIVSIKNLKESSMENKELWNFFTNNYETIQELTQRYNDYKSAVFSRVLELRGLLPKEHIAPSAVKQHIWDGRKEDDDCVVLVHDYNIAGYSISIDTTVRIKGWSISIFGRDAKSRDFLIYKMCNKIDFLPKSLDQYQKDNERLIYQNFTIDTDIEIVAEALKDLLSRVEKYQS